MTDSLTPEQKEDLVKLETTRAVLMKMLSAEEREYEPSKEEIEVMKEMFEKYPEFLLQDDGNYDVTEQ